MQRLPAGPSLAAHARLFVPRRADRSLSAQQDTHVNRRVLRRGVDNGAAPGPGTGVRSASARATPMGGCSGVVRCPRTRDG